MRRAVRLAYSCAGLLLAGCASGPFDLIGAPGRGTADIPHYRAAMRAQHLAGIKVLDRLAWAESRLLAKAGGNAPDGFDPNRAAAVLGVGDPPRTAVLRQALETVTAFNALLIGDGGSDGAVPIWPASASVAEGAAMERISAALHHIAPVLRRTSQDGVAGATPKIRELLLALRAATPAIYEILHVAEVVPGNLEDPDGIPAEGRTRLAADRKSLAGWVLLIDQTLVTVELAAITRRSGDPADRAALIAAAIRLNTLADAVAARRGR